MVKILLVAVNDVMAEGLRMLSASLKQHRHQPYIVFLQRNAFPYTDEKKYVDASKIIEAYDWVGIDAKGEAYRFCRGPELTAAEEKLFLSLIKDIKPDVIGFTVTSPFVKRIAYLSTLIKSKYNIPIIWGGPGATSDPTTCADYCDYVCIGEGENTIVDIAAKIDNKEDIKEVNNLAYLQDGKLVQNPLYPLIANLDELPMKDIYPKNKFLIQDDCLVSDFSEVSYTGGRRYHIMTSRGCPNSCTYCSENFVKTLYSHQKYLRRRSPANVIKELEKAKKMFNFPEVQFEDEVFSYDYKWLQEFGDLYKKRINKPFACYIYPNKHIERQLKLLQEIGLIFTCLALQSGSDRINREIFKRNFDKKLYLETAHMLKAMNIGYYVDVITYNPFETKKDLQDTLDVLMQLPKPFIMFCNKLYFIKGTEIHALVKDLTDIKKKGGETDEHSTLGAFRGPKARKEKPLVADRTFNYYSRLFFLAQNATTRNKNYELYFINKIRIFQYFPSLLTLWANIQQKVYISRFTVESTVKKFVSLPLLPLKIHDRVQGVEQRVQGVDQRVQGVEHGIYIFIPKILEDHVSLLEKRIAHLEALLSKSKKN